VIAAVTVNLVLWVLEIASILGYALDVDESHAGNHTSTSLPLRPHPLVLNFFYLVSSLASLLLHPFPLPSSPSLSLTSSPFSSLHSTRSHYLHNTYTPPHTFSLHSHFHTLTNILPCHFSSLPITEDYRLGSAFVIASSNLFATLLFFLYGIRLLWLIRKFRNQTFNTKIVPIFFPPHQHSQVQKIYHARREEGGEEEKEEEEEEESTKPLLGTEQGFGINGDIESNKGGGRGGKGRRGGGGGYSMDGMAEGREEADDEMERKEIALKRRLRIETVKV
jgi:hypothetical protein